MPENVSNLNITQNSIMLEIPPPQSTQELVGHNTTTTTDEEEAAKALIALGNMSNISQEADDVGEDNVDLMPIGGAIAAVEAHPVPIRLQRKWLKPSMTYHMKTRQYLLVINQIQQQQTKLLMPQCCQQKENWRLKTTDWKNSAVKKRSYKCQSCGKHEKSVHELNEHHQTSHLPLMCGKCNKLFNVPFTLQLHMYDHQKKKLPCEICVTVVSVRDALRQGRGRWPDVLSCWVPSMQVWPNTISNWGALCSAVPMGGTPCSVSTPILGSALALVCNELNYWAGRYICVPWMV